MREGGIWTGSDNGWKRNRLATIFSDCFLNEPGHFSFCLARGEGVPNRMERLFGEPYGFKDLLDLGIVFYYPESLNKVFSRNNLRCGPGFRKGFLYLFELLEGKEMRLHSQPFGLELQKQVGQKLLESCGINCKLEIPGLLPCGLFIS